MHRRVTGLANSSSSLTVPRRTQAEIVVGCRSSSAVASDRSVLGRLRVLHCWLCQGTVRALAFTPAGQASDVANFHVGALSAQFVARSYF